MSGWAIAVCSLLLLLSTHQHAGVLLIGRSLSFVPPVIGGDGGVIVFGSAYMTDNTLVPATNLYAYVSGLGAPPGLRQLTHFAGSTSPLGATAVAAVFSVDRTYIAYTALPKGPGGPEEVHVFMAPSTDRTLVTDTQGCIQPLACPNCFFSCLNTPHLSPDGSTVLYAAARSQPFYTVKADGSGLMRLPVSSGSLAPAPQRVITRDGLVVFTSSAPSGPTFAASPTQIYVVNLDGTGLRQVTHFVPLTVFASNAIISADGSTIAFESNLDPTTGGDGTIERIWTINGDGTGLRTLSTGTTDATSPSLSADGSMVAFVQDGQIFVASTHGQAVPAVVTRFTVSAAANPALSDNGSLVAFTVSPPNGGAAAIYAAATDGRTGGPVYAPRTLNVNGVGGAAGGAAPAAGSLISVYGTNLGGEGIVTAGAFPLPLMLAGLSLLVNGQPVPLLAVTPWQVNAQLPPDLTPGTVNFQLSLADGVATPVVTAEVKIVAPAVFAYPARVTPGSGVYMQAAAFHAGTAIPVDASYPAVAGEAIEIYGTGLGPTDPQVPAGEPSPGSPPARTLTQPEVIVGGRSATVLFSGLAPGLAGVYQVNAVVPDGLKPGLQGLTWHIADSVSSNASIAVK